MQNHHQKQNLDFGTRISLGLVSALLITLGIFNIQATKLQIQHQEIPPDVALELAIIPFLTEKAPEPPTKAEQQKRTPSLTPTPVLIDLPTVIAPQAGSNGTSIDTFLPNIGDENKYEEPAIQIMVEEMPQFPGGEKALFSFLKKNLKYPRLALDNQITGTVVIQFVVSATGKISKAQIVKSIGYGCDEEALKIVSAMPDWTPGKQGGKPVHVQLNLPIRFMLKN